MKKEHRLRYIIKEGILDMFYVWKDELKNVFKDSGVMIFFFLVPFIYPLLYSFIYNNEVVHEAKMVVVDQSDSYLSREFVRRVNATSDVQVVKVCSDMKAAEKMLDEKEAYGILYFPSDFSKEIHKGNQTEVVLYCDMSSLLFYKAFLLAATEVSLELGAELRAHNNPVSTEKMQEITVNPIPYESVALYNTQNGFASFLVPAILILVIQQTLILGIGMLGGTAREKNRFHSLVPVCRHFNGTLRIVLGKSLTYILLYVVVCIWVLLVVPKLFGLPQVGEGWTILLFLLPYLFACIFFSMTLSGFMTSRESPMMVFVFTSVILLFISGVSWPKEAIPPFWKAVGYFFPSTPGIQGFIRINTCGATLNEVAHEYHILWIQAGVYFVLACVIYRFQILRRSLLDQAKSDQ
ncbi:ABC transporter permease [Parabacteroides bouchesdurhonensis]|uniref:ABC transporter permease n=1 Tax=Parabacteroides bouchesdurhonensis TaxID=1936995 RepID=UPI000C84B0D6|nr:ABC transporter permease [Parabacteroides bouchesdurhonensis]